MATTLEYRAHQASVTLSIEDVIRDLRGRLGATLVAYIGGVKETRAVRQWISGERKPSAAVANRLRTAHQVSSLLLERHSEQVTQAWMQGMNPDLDDASPARVLRDSDLDEAGALVLAAARHFAVA